MDSPMIKSLCGALDKIASFKAKKRTFVIVFVLYIILLSTVTYFHEPWFDEAQAWQISRCASLSDILFKIPHYEGHPPLWHLLLLPFAKTGMPYEFSLAFVNILFSAAAAWIIIFRTKLPDLMRLTAPFTYFFFYQYGVISRPYSVMTFALMLCAVFYREKNQKPLRMVLSLALLCLSSAYGLAIAAGICIVWLIEEWNGKNIFKFIKDFIKTKAFFCLLGLLIFAVLLLLCIMPYSEAAAISVKSIDKFRENLLYILFILPFDSTIGYVLINDELIGFAPYYAAYIPADIAVVAVLSAFGKKHKKLKLLIIPFIFMIPLAMIYMRGHHIGIITAFIVFWICVCLDSDGASKTLKHENILHYVFIGSVCAFIAVQTVWSASSSAADIKYNYSEGRAMADYIKENNLEDKNIMSAWHAVKINNGNDQRYYNFNSSSTGTVILPYFDSNIFSNLKDDMGYNEHKALFDEEEYAQMLESFRQLDFPEYIFGTLEFSSDELDDIFSKNTYTPYFYIADNIEYCMVFKGGYSKEYAPIYKFENIENVLKEVSENEGTD